jgi:dUTP pyrophosphatase
MESFVDYVQVYLGGNAIITKKDGVVNIQIPPYEKCYTYKTIVPVAVGKKVKAPVGKSNNIMEGIVTRIGIKEEDLGFPADLCKEVTIVEEEVIKFEKLNDEAILPVRATEASAGYDIHTIEDGILNPGDRKIFKTGLAIKLPKEYYAAVVSKSGRTIKEGLIVANAPGIVDADYYPNEIGIILYNIGTQTIKVEKGSKVAQIIIHKYYKVEDDVATESRNGGFGSTGV